RRQRSAALAVVLVLGLVAAACGDDDSGSTGGAATTTPSAATSASSGGTGTAAPDDVDPDGVFRMGLALTEVQFDPATLSTGVDIMTWAVYGSLLQRTTEGYEPG